MDYGKAILHVLYEAGTAGLSVQKIAIHVHNANNSLFAPVAFDVVHREVQAWLLRNSRGKHPVVCHGDKWGYYTVNTMSSMAQQLALEFDKESVGASQDNNGADGTKTMPSLFD